MSEKKRDYEKQSKYWTDRDDEARSDYRVGREFQNFKTEVLSFVTSLSIVTVGGLSRRFPERRAWLADVIDALESDGEISREQQTAQITNIVVGGYKITPEPKLTHEKQGVELSKHFTKKANKTFPNLGLK